MITLKTYGTWYKTFSFLNKNKKLSTRTKAILNRAAIEGVSALSNNTPKDTGLAASSWSYDIKYGKDRSIIQWCNSDLENGYNVAILIQYGHATKGGRYVEGRDFINPAIRPIFDNFINTLWKEVIGDE